MAYTPRARHHTLLFLRVCPDQLEEAKQLVLNHGRSLGILFEEVVLLMHKSLEPELYSQVLFNLVEQGALTLSPLGRLEGRRWMCFGLIPLNSGIYLKS